MQGFFMLQQVVYGGYQQPGCKTVSYVKQSSLFYEGVDLEMTTVNPFHAEL